MHGDYWYGNLLVARQRRTQRVVGVVDWEAGALFGEPLRDVARFAVSYSLYLDRHVRPGHRIPGHRGLRADGWGAGLTHAVHGEGWYAALVRGYVTAAAERLGVPGGLWREILLVASYYLLQGPRSRFAARVEKRASDMSRRFEEVRAKEDHD